MSHTYKREKVCFSFSLKQNIGKLMENYLILARTIYKDFDNYLLPALTDF